MKDRDNRSDVMAKDKIFDLTPAQKELWDACPDLQCHFNIELEEGRKQFLQWWETYYPQEKEGRQAVVDAYKIGKIVEQPREKWGKSFELR